MKFYYCYVNTYYKDKLVYTNFSKKFLTEEPSNSCHDISWDNLDEFYSKNKRFCGFSVRHDYRGRRIFFYEKVREIKEWKKPSPLDITVKFIYTEMTPSLGELLEYPNSEESIAYLREKGISLL